MRPCLQAIAHAGFSHVHWCYEWNTDNLYNADVTKSIGALLRETGLSVLDLHASQGREISWGSIGDENRRAGVALVVNRMETVAAFGADVVVLHIPFLNEFGPGGWLSPVLRSLDELEPHGRKLGVRIALENTGSAENWEQLSILFPKYPADFLGLCYDSGHGNYRPQLSLGKLEEFKDRLIAIHLHDSDGTDDQHMVPFSGTVDWKLLAGILARSSYNKCMSLECSMKNHRAWSREQFLKEALSAGRKLAAMVNESA
jgi:sugar phosphate isomerase/epimerase